MLNRTVHPGVTLKDEIDERGITPTALAREIGVPANRITQIIRGERSITCDTAHRLGKWFNTGPEFWMNLQSHHDLVVSGNNIDGKIDNDSHFGVKVAG